MFMVMLIIFTTNAQWSALFSGIELEHVTPHSGEDVRLRVGFYANTAAAPISANGIHHSLCYDTASAAFPQVNGTFDAFVISKRLETIDSINFTNSQINQVILDFGF